MHLGALMPYGRREPMSSQSGPDLPFDRTLAEERAANTRRINTFRFQALTAFLALLLLFRLSIRIPHLSPAPLDSPMIVILTDDAVVDRVGTMSSCRKTSTGMICAAH